MVGNNLEHILMMLKRMGKESGGANMTNQAIQLISDMEKLQQSCRTRQLDREDLYSDRQVSWSRTWCHFTTARLSTVSSHIVVTAA